MNCLQKAHTKHLWKWDELLFIICTSKHTRQTYVFSALTFVRNYEKLRIRIRNGSSFLLLAIRLYRSAVFFFCFALARFFSLCECVWSLFVFADDFIILWLFALSGHLIAAMAPQHETNSPCKAPALSHTQIHIQKAKGESLSVRCCPCGDKCLKSIFTGGLNADERRNSEVNYTKRNNNRKQLTSNHRSK